MPDSKALVSAVAERAGKASSPEYYLEMLGAAIEHTDSIGQALRVADRAVQAQPMPLPSASDRMWRRVLEATAGFSLAESSTRIDGQGSVGAKELSEETLRRDFTRRERKILSYLSDEEKRTLQRHTAKQLIEHFNKLAPTAEFVEAAKGGKAKRGWYEDAASTLEDLFGTDTPRFVALLAATSPRQGVKRNLITALRVWRAWNEAGRPNKTVTRKRLDAEGKTVTYTTMPFLLKMNPKPMLSYHNNVANSLSVSDDDILLSGDKVESFRRNLMGDLDASTNDVWMAMFGRISHSVLGKKLAYKAYTAKVRMAAEELGEDWRPAEVQECVWSYFRTLAGLVKGITRGKDGKEIPKSVAALEALEAINDEHVKKTVDFVSLMAENPDVQRELAEHGDFGREVAERAAAYHRKRVELAKEAAREPAAAEDAGTTAEGDPRIRARIARRAADVVESFREEGIDPDEDVEAIEPTKASTESMPPAMPATPAAAVATDVGETGAPEPAVSNVEAHSEHVPEPARVPPPGARPREVVTANEPTTSYAETSTKERKPKLPPPPSTSPSSPPTAPQVSGEQPTQPVPPMAPRPARRKLAAAGKSLGLADSYLDGMAKAFLTRPFRQGKSNADAGEKTALQMLPDLLNVLKDAIARPAPVPVVQVQSGDTDKLAESMAKVAEAIARPAPAPVINVPAPVVNLEVPAPVVPPAVVNFTPPPPRTTIKETTVERDHRGDMVRATVVEKEIDAKE